MEKFTAGYLQKYLFFIPIWIAIHIHQNYKNYKQTKKPLKFTVK